MSYYIDLKQISLDDYKTVLNESDLIPSWKVLVDKMEYINTLKKNDLKNIDELYNILNNKRKYSELLSLSGIDDDYLKVLRRAINSFKPKPNKFKDFPSLSEDIINNLFEFGYKNTQNLYNDILTKEQRVSLSKKIGITYEETVHLAKLTDLSRIKWVNHTFANVLLQSGYDTAKKVANANSKEMYIKIIELNGQKNLYKGHIGESDMNKCIESATILDFDIEY